MSIRPYGTGFVPQTAFFESCSLGDASTMDDGQNMEDNMFRLWGKIWKDSRMVRDTVYEEDSGDTRTHKIFRGLEEICREFDLGKPIWLDATVSQFQRHSKARFYQDSFIEEIPFDYLEIQVLQEG